MKSLKSTVAVICMLCISLSIFAQKSNANIEKRLKAQVEEMAKEIELTSEQQSAVLELMVDRIVKTNEIKEKNLPTEEQTAARKQVNQNYNKELRKRTSPELAKSINEWQKSHNSKKKQ